MKGSGGFHRFFQVFNLKKKKKKERKKERKKFGVPVPDDARRCIADRGLCRGGVGMVMENCCLAGTYLLVRGAIVAWKHCSKTSDLETPVVEPGLG